MKKRTIIVCEYISTGINYVDDIRARGYEPVLLEGNYVGTEEETGPLKETRNAINARLKGSVKIIPENPDYNEILRQVRELDPVLVVAGSEFGVPLATKLGEDLGLPGNPVSALPAMTEKDAMQEALKKAGLRYIRGKVITTEADAEAYYRELGTEDVVVKRVRGAATQGVYLCHGHEEMLKAVRLSLASDAKDGGEKVAVLLQERILGQEYIVNTVSCKGRHFVDSVWKYDKIKMPNGTNAYNNAMTVPRLEIGHASLMRYACQTASAVGVQYGPIHGEYMIDEKGPVLIEVNCRPMGAGLQRKYTEEIFGHHETDLALDSYLDPEKFEAEMQKPYRVKKFGAIKLFILPEDTEVFSAPVMQIAKHLKSYYSAVFDRIGRGLSLSETVDLESMGGTVYLLHEDERLVREECELLHLLEMKYPRILYQETFRENRFVQIKPDIAGVLRSGNCRGATIVFSDTINDTVGDTAGGPEDGTACATAGDDTVANETASNGSAGPLQGVTVVSEESLPDAYDSFEQGILDLSQPDSFRDMESTIQKIYQFASKIRRGGRMLIPESTYAHLPYGMEGMEILLKVAGLRVEMPMGDMKSLLIASVE